MPNPFVSTVPGWHSARRWNSRLSWSCCNAWLHWEARSIAMANVWWWNLAKKRWPLKVKKKIGKNENLNFLRIAQIWTRISNFLFVPVVLSFVHFHAPNGLRKFPFKWPTQHIVGQWQCPFPLYAKIRHKWQRLAIWCRNGGNWGNPDGSQPSSTWIQLDENWWENLRGNRAAM